MARGSQIRARELLRRIGLLEFFFRDFRKQIWSFEKVRRAIRISISPNTLESDVDEIGWRATSAEDPGTGVHFLPRGGSGTVGAARKRVSASPRFWINASEVNTSASGRKLPAGATGSTSSS